MKNVAILALKFEGTRMRIEAHKYKKEGNKDVMRMMSI